MKPAQFIFKPIAMIFLCVLGVFSSTSHAQNQFTYSSFLNSFSTIRILVVDAPGFGHQMTAVYWLHRLREMGYAGRYEVVYENNEQTEEKLRTLIPELKEKLPAKNGAIETFVESLNASFVSMKDFQQNPNRFAQVDLAIIPAEDIYVRGGLPGQIHPLKPTSIQTLKADVLLRAQPPKWEDGRRGIETADNEKINLNNLFPLQLKLLQWSNSSETLLDDSGPLKKSLATSGYSNQLSNDMLQFFLNPGNTDTLALYEQHTPLTSLLRVLEGAHQYLHSSEKKVPIGAQDTLRRINEGFVRPGSNGLVVAVGSKLTDFNFKILEKSINENPLFRDRTRIVRSQDLLTGGFEQVKPKNPSEIVIVHLPSPPPMLIEFLFRHSKLPPVVAGKYSQNLLVQMGRPYVEAVVTNFFELWDFPQGPRKIIRDATEDLDSKDMQYAEPGTPPPDHRGSALARFFEKGQTDLAIKAEFLKLQLKESDTDLIEASLTALQNFSLKKGCADSLGQL